MPSTRIDNPNKLKFMDFLPKLMNLSLNYEALGFDDQNVILQQFNS